MIENTIIFKIVAVLPSDVLVLGNARVAGDAKLHKARGWLKEDVYLDASNIQKELIRHFGRFLNKRLYEFVERQNGFKNGLLFPWSPVKNNVTWPSNAIQSFTVIYTSFVLNASSIETTFRVNS